MSNSKFVLRAVVLSLAGTVLVFLGVGQVLADEWTVATTHVVSSDEARVAAAVKDLRRWQEWSSLEFPLGNPTERQVSGESGAVGQEVVWSGPLGKAAVTFDAVTPRSIEYRIGFVLQGGNVGGKYTGSIAWEPRDDGVAVTWTEHGKMSSLVERWSNWFGALQDKVQQIQQASLLSLDNHLQVTQDK
ncbi:MAG: SRPBCC family protein [Planctomycetota bacterium]|nr:SRPBCC family protein [Planctomycetota bacterium]